jgi:SpoVK/Ycf46/Vps4 family AAA+-type ATPase
MKGDFNSSNHNSKKYYGAVSQQQGRVELDADWNENVISFAASANLRYIWQDIDLPEDALAQLEEIVAQMVKREKKCKILYLITKKKNRRGIIALFSGSNDTGKTMASKVIASEVKLDMYRIDLSQVISKYIEETEKYLGKVFETANHSGAILFFDEADALFGKRTELKSNHDRYKNIVVNYILHQINHYSGLIILATKHHSSLGNMFFKHAKLVIDFPEKRAVK